MVGEAGGPVYGVGRGGRGAQVRAGGGLDGSVYGGRRFFGGTGRDGRAMGRGQTEEEG